MKIIPELYECEVCHDRFSNIKTAEACEKVIAPAYPIGMIYGDHTRKAFYTDMTFAIAKIRIEGHSNDSPLWACRKIGDTLGDRLCGGNFLELGKRDAKLKYDHPTFIRMVAFLTKRKIPITIWNGNKAIPYNKKVHK